MRRGNSARQGPPQKKNWDRMELMSMVPLEIDPKDSSPLPKSALEQNYDTYTKTMSNFARMLEYSVKDPNLLAEPDVEIPKFEHKITSYKPAFEAQASVEPEPTSYYPKYDAIKPSIAKSSIGELPKGRRPRQIDETTASIVQRYSNGLRDLDTKSVLHSENFLQELHPTLPDRSIPSGEFSKQSKRKVDELFKTSINTNVDYYSPPPEKVKVLPFKEQLDRKTIVKVDEGRDYSEGAIAAIDKLQSRHSAVVPMGRQLGRDPPPKRNERVAFLEEIEREQRSLLDKFRRSKSQQRSPPPRKPTFEMQASRRPLDDRPQLPDSRFPINIQRSLKAVWPRTRVATIRPPPPPSRGGAQTDFWSTRPGCQICH